MTKIQKIALADYKLEPTEENYKLVLHAFNPLTDAPKTAKKILNLYIKTGEKARLKQFVSLLGEVESIKKESPKEKYKTEQLSSKDELELKALDKELATILKTTYSASSQNPEVITKIREIKARMLELGLKTGLTNERIEPSLELADRYDREIVTNIFGQLDNPDSLISKMFEGKIDIHVFRASNHGSNLECLKLNELIGTFKIVYGRKCPYPYFVEKVWNKGGIGMRLELRKTSNPNYTRNLEGAAVETIG